MSELSKRPVLALAIDPRSRIDRDRLDSALWQLASEDPTLSVRTDIKSNQVIVAGVSERQLESIVARLTGEFNVVAAIGALRVIYKEAFSRPANGEGRFVRQSGGRGQYAHAKIHLVPTESGSGFVFENKTYGSIPTKFIGPLEEGIREALTRRSVAGYAIDDVRDVRIELCDASYHDVDSSEAAFKIAGAMAIEDATAKSGPVLLEPVMRVEVVVPSDDASNAMRDLSKRRGAIESYESRGEALVINACLPVSTTIGYETDLRSRTRDRATCSIQFDRYEPCNVRPDIEGDDRLSSVRTPRTPAPKRDDSAVAVPEPEEDDIEC